MAAGTMGDPPVGTNARARLGSACGPYLLRMNLPCLLGEDSTMRELLQTSRSCGFRVGDEFVVLKVQFLKIGEGDEAPWNFSCEAVACQEKFTKLPRRKEENKCDADETEKRRRVNMYAPPSDRPAREE